MALVISHFINDYERHGHYTGFPALGIEWQKMESPVLRSALGMKVSLGLHWTCHGAWVGGRVFVVGRLLHSLPRSPPCG